MAVKPKLLALSALIAITLLSHAPLYDDHRMIKNLMLYDQPVHIIPLDEAVEISRGYSYRSCGDASMPLWLLYYSFWEKGDTVSVQYMTRELMRQATISERVFNNNRIDMLEQMLKDVERTKLWLRARKRRRECIDRIFNKNDRSPEIESILFEALRDAERAGFKRWSIDFYEVMADYLFAIGQDEKAFGYLQKTYEISITSVSNSTASHVAGRIGEYYRRNGDFGKARDAFSKSLFHARLIEDHYNIARALSFMARLNANEGNFIGAEKLHWESIEECGCIIDPICELQKTYLLAELYTSFGHLEKAVYFTERAILLAEKNLQEFETDDNIKLVKSLTNYLAYSRSLLAQIQLKQAKFDEAVVTMEQTLMTSKHSIDRFLYAELEKTMSEAYLAAGRLNEASRNIDNSLKLARTLKKRRLEAECLVTRADVRIAQGKFDEADDLLAEADNIADEEELWPFKLDTERLRAESAALRGRYRKALDHYENAAARFDAESAAIIYEEDKHTFAEKMREIYESIIDIQDEHFNDSDSVTFWAEKYRHKPHGDVCKIPIELSQTIRLVLSEKDWIPYDTVIIQYIVTADRLIIIAKERNRTIHNSIPIDREYLEGQIQEFFETCYSFKKDPVKSGKKMQRMTENFYAILIEPLSTIMEGKKILCFVPAHPLHRLPFAALTKPNGECRFLVEDMQITTAPTLLDILKTRAAVDSRISHPRFTSALLVGHADIDAEIHRLFPALDELPHTEGEMLAVKELIGSCTTLCGKGATPSAFLQNAEESDLIHIATHTITYPSYGGKSALVLSPDPGDLTEDSIMRSLVFDNDIRNLQLRGTCLVVISSCESAPAASTGSGSGTGLAGWFLHAGADAVIATIWPIEDHFTETIITAFYRELLSGSGDPTEALCNIQRTIIAEDRSVGTPFAHVCEWAPFVAMGSPIGHNRH
jgi:CHAT domain-containing protein/tetratricopeptide (TPR) repeat protein